MAAQGQNRKQRLPTSASAERRTPAVREVNLVAGSDLMLRSLCIGGYLSKLLLHGGARSLCGGAILYAEERFMPVRPMPPFSSLGSRACLGRTQLSTL